MIWLCYFISVLSEIQSKPIDPFQPHVDYQKVIEFGYKNETYKILKPVVHKVTDHFKDFMLRRDSNHDLRVFLDDDGFSHTWSGFGRKKGNLRKNDNPTNENDDKAVNNNENVEETAKVDENTENDGENLEVNTEINGKTETLVESIKHDDDGLVNIDVSHEKDGEKVEVNTQVDNTIQSPETTENPSENTYATANYKNEEIEEKSKEAPRDGVNAKEEQAQSPKEEASEETKKALRHNAQVKILRAANTTKKSTAKATTKQVAGKISNSGSKGRTAVKTYFFCPFFGVIVMNAFVD